MSYPMSPDPTSVRVARAWLLEYRSGRFAAFALHATLALLDGPAYAPVPGAPMQSLGLMRWENHRMPLIDLGLLGEGAMQAGGDVRPGHALVVAWKQSGSGRPAGLGAIAAPKQVTMIEVRDQQQCEAPQDSGMLRLLAASWFEHEGRPVAVIDTARLFSGWLAGARAAAPVA